MAHRASPQGDVGKVSSLLVRLVSLFHLTILADVEKDSAAPFRGLRPATSSLGPGDGCGWQGIDRVERWPRGDHAALALGRGGEQLTGRKRSQPGPGTPDRPHSDHAPFRRHGRAAARWRKNLPVIERHAVLVSPADGRLWTLVWVLVREDSGQLRLAEPTIRLLDAAIEEDRKLYVDAGLFDISDCRRRGVGGVRRLATGARYFARRVATNHCRYGHRIRETRSRAGTRTTSDRRARGEHSRGPMAS